MYGYRLLGFWLLTLRFPSFSRYLRISGVYRVA